MQVRTFDLTQRVLIVAEIGNNHEGNFEVAERLVGEAADAGADAVKFQTYSTERFVGPEDRARVDRLKSFELKPSQFESLARTARKLGLLFISTPLDLESAAILEPLVDAYKVASGDNDFYPLIDRLARTGHPMILSTGLSDAGQVKRSIASVERIRGEARTREGLAILHCVSAYPVPEDQANLLSIPWLAGETGLTVGYSDHTLGIEACVLAAAVGARIIEKHFTLDKAYSEFRDHRISADPADLRELVVRIRRAVTLLGAPGKRVQPVEESLMVPARRSAVAVRDLVRGHPLSAGDVAFLRPGGGIGPGQTSSVLGRRLIRDLPAGSRLSPSDFEPPTS